MTSMDVSSTRGRGRNAGIDARRIIEAARGLEPEMLTMQAVARQLGVDRSAVNYHVKDRESLRELVARDAFAREFTRFVFPTDADWQSACRAYVTAMRDALVETGALAAYFRYDVAGGLELLRPAELLLEKLLDAGFDERLVGRASQMLANIAMALARDLIAVAKAGEHPQVRVLHEALGHADAADFPAMRRAMAMQHEDAYGDAQLDASVQIFVYGLERMHEEWTADS